MLRASTGLEVTTDNEEQSIGAKIILDAVEEPLRQMAKNAGKSPDLIVDRVRHLSGAKGFNFNDLRHARENTHVQKTKYLINNAKIALLSACSACAAPCACSARALSIDRIIS